MEKLIFNTTTKTVDFFSETWSDEKYTNVSTVTYLSGFYEVIREENDGKKYPVFRTPISNTIMIIEK